MLASLSSFYDNIRSYSPLASKPGQKRPRNEEDEDVIITDVLQTPPAKRLRNIEETGAEDSNKSTIKTFSKFVSKKIKSWSDKYIWRYVVKGRTTDNSDTTPNRDQNLAEEMEQDRFKRPVNVIPAYQTSNRRSTDLSRNPLIDGRWPETPSVFTCTSTPARSSVTVSGSGLMSIRGRGTTDQRPYMDKKYDPSKYRDNVDRSLHTTQPRTDRPSFTVGRDSRALPPSFSKSSWRSRAGQNRHASSRKSTVKQHRIISTAETVIRLNERERYKQLLAQYTSIELPDSRDETWNTTRMPTAHTTPLEVKTDFLTRTQSRTRVVDGSLLSPRSSLLPPPAVPFAAPASPPPPPVVLRVMPSPSKAADQSAHSTADVSLFSRPGPSEVSVNQTTVPKTSVKPSPEISVYSPFEEGWTKKWRDLLSDESLSRERDISREERKLEALKQKRQEETRTLTDKVKQRRRREELGLEELEDDEFEEVDEEEEEEEGTDAFVSLTDEMERRVDAALAPGYPDDPLVEGFRVTIKRSDMATLSNLNWLNDEIINFFFTLIVERSKEKGQPKVHAFNSFFYPKLIKSGYSSLRRWTKKVDIFSMDLVLVPVHLGMHWCLASIDMTKKCISYYDSLKGSNQQCLSSLRAYLNEESLDKKKTPLDLTGWTTATPKDIPEQLNGCDCGVFACKYAEYLSRRSKFDFDQRHMPYFRRRMVFEILNKKLL